ncbi:glycine C-acetyltransferase [Candidatus Micrarchaeota archaeon]|nr:glycine C-acetyltransferase [Candidatus Micrarchaeota archaeon]
MNKKFYEDLSTDMKQLEEQNLVWDIKTLESASEGRGIINGKECLILCSNNYLGLANNPEVKKASLEAVEKYGAGSGSVRAIAGTMDLHLELEEKIAKFKHTQDALYYNTGFTANSGALPQLLRKGDLCISDELNHGSIIDGVRLSKADKTIYKHKNMEDLRNRLKEAKEGNYGRVLIITDGVFSMDGDVAPLKEIVELAEEFEAVTYIDDAHGDGVLGDHGRGISSHFGVEGRVDIEMGTFSKAFGVMGGYISGETVLKKFLLNKSRTWLLTASHPPAVAAACIASLDILERNDELVKKLWENTRYFKGRLKELGFDIGESETPITPIMTYESKKAKEMSRKLYDEGIFALPIVFPMVAKDKARIRTMMNASHTKEDLDFAVEKIEKIGKELELIK